MPAQQNGNQNADTNPGDEAPPGTPGTGEDICPDCHGTGKINASQCKTCGGTGKITEAIGGG
jgi:DnaJ-class molecular chaperone